MRQSSRIFRVSSRPHPAGELQSLLSGKRKTKSTMFAPVGSGKLQTGIGDAILSTFDDSQSHSIDDVEEHLRARGFTPKKVVVQLSVFTQKGKLRRVSRGVYAKN